MIKFDYMFEFLIQYIHLVSTFLSHPFIIALTIYFLGKYTLHRIIPDRKEKTIEKFVELKNLLGEAELCYNRISNTFVFAFHEKDIVLDNKDLPDIKLMGVILNERLPLHWFQFKNEVETYFEDETLLKKLEDYDVEFSKLYNATIINLINDPFEFLEKFSTFKKFPFQELKEQENELLNALQKAKSIKLRNR